MNAPTLRGWTALVFVLVRTVEDYATDLFNTWGIGKKDRDNGVLILVVVQHRCMRIEVGYGLEGIRPSCRGSVPTTTAPACSRARRA